MNTNENKFHGVRMTPREIDIKIAATMDETARVVKYLREYAASVLPKTENPTNEKDVLDAMLAGTVQALAKSIEEGGHRE